MTKNQIDFASLQEQKRMNDATLKLRGKELAETKRGNLAREQENYRSNLVREAETSRSNIAREKETNRSNLATEQLKAQSNQIEQDKLSESNRHNLATEDHNAYATGVENSLNTKRLNLEQKKFAQQQKVDEATINLRNQQAKKAEVEAISNVFTTPFKLFMGGTK